MLSCFANGVLSYPLNHTAPFINSLGSSSITYVPTFLAVKASVSPMGYHFKFASIPPPPPSSITSPFGCTLLGPDDIDVPSVESVHTLP